MSHPITNRLWVTLLYFFAGYSHQSWPTACEWHCFTSLPHFHQWFLIPWPRKWVTLLYFFARYSHLEWSHPMTNSKWVTLLYFFVRHSHQWCLIPWLTASEWQCFISLPGTLINDVSSHDQQVVSDITLCLCQALSSMMSHPMIKEVSYTALFICQALSSWMMSHPHDQQQVSDTALCLCQALSPMMPSSHDQQQVSDTALFLFQALSSMISDAMANREWVTQLYFFARHSHQSCL